MKKDRYFEEDFNVFLKQLLNSNVFDEDKVNGIVQLAIDNGFDKLSNNQQYVVQNAIKPFIIEKCKRGGCEIPWLEMFAAEDNGGVCSWCQQLGRDDSK